MGKFKTTFLIVSIFYIAICFCKPPFAGPYETVFRSMYHCPGIHEEAFLYNTRVSKFNRTHSTYTTNISLSLGFLDSMKVTADLSVFGNGGWQDNFMHIPINKACRDTLKMVPGFLESLFQASGRRFTGCPVSPGVYEVKNWIWYFHLAMNIFPYNKYKAVFKISENEKTLSCFTLEFDVIPERKRRLSK